MVDDEHDAVAVLEREADRFGEAGFDAGADHDAIDDRFDVVRLLGNERGHVFDRVDGAVDAHADEAGFLDRFDHFAMGAASAADHRGEQHDAGLGRQSADGRFDFGRRLLRDRRVALGTGDVAGAREEQPQVVVDFGDRGDGAARVRIALSLVDGDRGLEAVDVVDVGPLHLIEELPGVDRQALDVLPLALGEQRVEGERAFAGAAHAR